MQVYLEKQSNRPENGQVIMPETLEKKNNTLRNTKKKQDIHSKGTDASRREKRIIFHVCFPKKYQFGLLCAKKIPSCDFAVSTEHEEVRDAATKCKPDIILHYNGTKCAVIPVNVN